MGSSTTSTLLTSPIVVVHPAHLGNLSHRDCGISTTECAIPKLRICANVSETPFRVFRGAEKLHSDLTTIRPGPWVLSAGNVL